MVDSGLASLCLIARYLGVPAGPAELARRNPASSSGASIEDLVRIARKLGLKARIVAMQWGRLAKTPLPAVVADRDGAFLVASRFFDGKLLVQRPTEPRGRLVERSQFEEAWVRYCAGADTAAQPKKIIRLQRR